MWKPSGTSREANFKCRVLVVCAAGGVERARFGKMNLRHSRFLMGNAARALRKIGRSLIINIPV